MNDKSKIEVFLEGRDIQTHITSIEADYMTNCVTVFIDDPVKGKTQEKHLYTPFLFMKDLKENNIQLYKNKQIRNEKINEYGIKIQKLRTDNNLRLESGFKYLVTSSKSVTSLSNFFKLGGYDVYERKDLFLISRPEEQFLMYSGKKLFKGFEYYKDVHKLYFDIETTGLDPNTERIFMIGIKDNRGFEHLIEIEDNNDESEKEAISLFFKVINELKPSLIGGYNSENFDFPFIIKRCEILGIDIQRDFPTSLDRRRPISRKKGFLKMASETEQYEKTVMYGYNVIDIAHSVRRAKAINSDIKSWNLKYITKYSGKAKKNRMYVPGDKIYEIYKENKKYKINRETNEYELIKENEYVSATEDTITGKEIVKQYLLDDLWETEQIDETYGQSSFLLSKIIPTSFSRVCTMGTAVTWKMLMTAYSYENKLSIPNNDKKRDFVGGLARLFKLGYSENVAKFDFSGLYPSIMIEHDVFPDCDIDKILKKLLVYFKDTRNKYKRLKNKYKGEKNEELANYYDTRQLPLKILNNGMFGSLSAPEVFPWADMDCGEMITCTGRLYLRRMIDYFEKYGLILMQLDTDGNRYAVPKSIDSFEYIGEGNNDLVRKGKKYEGIEGLTAQFNDKYMIGSMGLDIDEICKSAINMARKNYVDLKLNDTIKITGNTLKSDKLQIYLEEFIDKSVKLLLHNQPKEFVEYYYQYLEKIYNKQMPLLKMANKAKVKLTKKQYISRRNNTNINGKPLPRMAYWELLIENNMNRNLGEIIYYVNTGKMASHQDVGNSSLVDPEKNKDELGHYNVPRYISIFNKRIKPLLTCFKSEVRDTLLVKNPKDRQYYTESQLKLQMEDLDSIEETMCLDQREIDFWNKVGKDPKKIFDKFTINNSKIKLDIDKYENIINKFKEKFKKEGIDVKSYKEQYKNGDYVISYKLESDKETWFLNEVIGNELKELEEIN